MNLRLRTQGSPAQALVEFALLLPVMLLLLLGLVDFGRAYVAGISLEGAAREGARLASTLAIPTGSNGTCALSTATAKWCQDVTDRGIQAAQPETVIDANITICIATVVPPAAPPACAATAADAVPTTSGQAVTVTVQT